MSMWFRLRRPIPQDPGEMASLPLSASAAPQGVTANARIEAPVIILLPHTGFLSKTEQG